MDVDAIRKGKS